MRSRLILGTVQLGLDYGINNQSGKPNLDEAFRILDCAREAEVKGFDTAAAYGNAHEVLGKWFKSRKDAEVPVYTKFAPGTALTEGLADQFLHELHVDRLAGLSFHRLADFRTNHAHRREELMELVYHPSIGKIGVSMHSNDEIDFCVHREHIQLVQFPYNALDNASQRAEIMAIADDNDMEMHTRSVFLQGLFFRQDIPEKLQPLSSSIAAIRQMATETGIELGQLLLAYALNSKSHGVLVGVENVRQLEEIVTWADNATAVPAEVLSVIDEIKIQNTLLLNPANWS